MSKILQSIWLYKMWLLYFKNVFVQKNLFKYSQFYINANTCKVKITDKNLSFWKALEM